MKGMKLSRKDRLIFAEWCKDFNATRAWMETHPKATYDSARALGSRWLAKVNVKEHIESYLKEKQMGADEALNLLADIARGDLGEFMDISSVGFNLDLLNEDGTRKNTRLIRKIKQKTTTFIAKQESAEDREVTETEIELYDAQAAIDKILRAHGRYRDVGTKENPITIENEIDNEKFDRTISTLIDALREGILGTDSKSDGSVGSAE